MENQKMELWSTVTATSGTLPDPFTMAKELRAVATVLEMVANRDGSYAVKTEEAVARKLWSRTKLPGGRTVKISGDPSRNKSSCVIHAPALANLECEDITAGFVREGYPITATRRLTKGNRPSSKGPSPIFALTFASPGYPSYISAGGLRIRTEKFKARPSICYRCLKHGHFARACGEREERCRRCGRAHASTSCTLPPECRNCGGGHESLSPLCPRTVLEKRVIQITQKQTTPDLRAAKRQAQRELGGPVAPIQPQSVQNRLKQTGVAVPSDAATTASEGAPAGAKKAAKAPKMTATSTPKKSRSSAKSDPGEGPSGVRPSKTKKAKGKTPKARKKIVLDMTVPASKSSDSVESILLHDSDSEGGFDEGKIFRMIESLEPENMDSGTNS